MSAKKRDMSAYEPSWLEVIFGAALSVVLGAVLGAVLLAIRPSAPVKEPPKEPVAGTIYYIQGSHDTAKSKTAPAKRKQFAQGVSGTLSFSEDEINSFLPPPPPLSTDKPKPDAKKAEAKKPDDKAKAAPKPGDKPGAPGAAPASSGEMLTLGAPNFHVHDGKVQIAVPATFSLLGFEQPLTAVADGNFVKQDGGYVFAADSLYLGSCPVHRVPGVLGFIEKKFIAALPVPPDVAAAWPKVADVAVEGNALKLTMP